MRTADTSGMTDVDLPSDAPNAHCNILDTYTFIIIFSYLHYHHALLSVLFYFVCRSKINVNVSALGVVRLVKNVHIPAMAAFLTLPDISVSLFLRRCSSTRCVKYCAKRKGKSFTSLYDGK